MLFTAINGVGGGNSINNGDSAFTEKDASPTWQTSRVTMLSSASDNCTLSIVITEESIEHETATSSITLTVCLHALFKKMLPITVLFNKPHMQFEII